MGISATIAAVAGIGGALISSNGAQKAADTQSQAADKAAQTQLQMYQQTQQQLAPWSSTGSAAMSQLASLFGFGPGGGASGTGAPDPAAMTSALEQTPGYQFQLGQGVQALDRSAASRGLLLSGAQLKDTQAYGQNLAMTNAWQPYVSVLQSASQLGENAAAGVGAQGTQAAAGAAQSQLVGGTAQADSQLAIGNSLAQTVSSYGPKVASSLGNFFGGSAGLAAALPGDSNIFTGG